MISTQILLTIFSVLSPKHVSPMSPQASLVDSPPTPFPGIYCLWLTPIVVNLVTVYSAVRLKHHRARAESLLGSGLLFPLRCCPLEGSGLPEHNGCCSMVDDSLHWDPRVYSLSSLPRASVPSLSSGVSSPLCPHLCQNPE